MKVTQVNFYHSPWIKCTYPSWVDFIRLNDWNNALKLELFELTQTSWKNHNYQKCTKRNFNLSLLSIQWYLCAWPITARVARESNRLSNRRACSIQQRDWSKSALAIQPWIQSTNWNNRNYIGRRCNCVRIRTLYKNRRS